MLAFGAAGLTVLLVLFGFGVYDAVVEATRRPESLPRQWVGGQLRSRTPPITSEGSTLLRTAVQILTALTEMEELRQQTTQADAIAWLHSATHTSGNDAELLASAALVLHEIESQDSVLESLTETRRKQVTEWLNQYLGRQSAVRRAT